MHLLRSTWGKRLIVVLLAGSLLPAAAVSTSGGASRVAALPYAAWLQTQLDVPSSARHAVERALAAASERPSPSLAAFLYRFVDAYEAQQPVVALGVLLSLDAAASTDALILLLRARYHRLASDGIFPRALLTVAAQAGKTPTRSPGLATRTYAAVASPFVYAASLRSAETAFVFLLRLCSSARPLGP